MQVTVLSSNKDSNFPLVLSVIVYIFCKFFVITDCSVTFPQAYNICKLLLHLSCLSVVKNGAF